MQTREFNPNDPTGKPIRGIPFKSIVLRVTDGKDEANAARMAQARGGASTPTLELIKASIVTIDGTDIRQPFDDFDAWKTKARRFADACFSVLNGVTDDDARAVLNSAQDDGEAVRFSFNGADGKPLPYTRIKSVTVREIDGRDEEKATLRARTQGGIATATLEMVRLSVVAVDGSAVGEDFNTDAWGSKDRALLFACWRELNSLSQAESDFLSRREIPTR